MVYIEVVMNYYKIRYKDDPEKYVKGTPMYHSYDKTGRIFQSLGNLRSFLTGVMNADARLKERNCLAEWEVVELEMVVRDTKAVHEVFTQKKIKELLMK